MALRSTSFHLLLWAIALLVLACQAPSSSDRFLRIDQEACPLFEDDFLTGNGLPRCPISTGKNTARPCAIEHYIEENSIPRSVRRLSYDAEGHLTEYSDHRGGHVTNARQLQREVDAINPGHVTVHQFAKHCHEPVPEHLYSLTYRKDSDGRLSTLASSTGYRATLRYTLQRRWFSDRALVIVDHGTSTPSELTVDTRGNVVANRGANGLNSRTVDERNGYVHGVSWSGESSGEFAEARYVYGGDRLQEIRFQAHTGHRQHYRFVYQCSEGPVCASQFERALDKQGPRSPSALSRDPELRRFRAISCTDQLTQGPRMCATVLHGQGPVSGRCCTTHPDRFQIEVRDPFAGPHVTGVMLSSDNIVVESAKCRGSNNYVICDFKRSDLEALPATDYAKLILKTATGQAVEQLLISLQAVAQANQ